MSYADLAEFKGFLRIPVEDETDDLLLQMALDSASTLIAQHCDRSFELAGEDAETRYFTTYWDRTARAYVVDIDDLSDTTDLVLLNGSTEVDLADLTFYPRNAYGLPWTALRLSSDLTSDTDSDAISITALWGWAEVPAAVKNACLLQASRFFKRRDAVFGVAGSPDMGNELRLLQKLDVDVCMMLSPYRKWWVAA